MWLGKILVVLLWAQSGRVRREIVVIVNCCGDIDVVVDRKRGLWRVLGLAFRLLGLFVTGLTTFFNEESTLTFLLPVACLRFLALSLFGHSFPRLHFVDGGTLVLELLQLGRLVADSIELMHHIIAFVNHFVDFEL